MSVVVRRAFFFSDEFDLRVVPVNCVGVMGAGLAKEAARRFPGLGVAYREACTEGRLEPGGLLELSGWPGVVLAATKDHFSKPSRGSWVLECAERLASLLAADGSPAPCRRVAVPALGCGLGGLPWPVYGPALAHALGGARADVEIVLIPPWGARGGAPAKGAMP